MEQGRDEIPVGAYTGEIGRPTGRRDDAPAWTNGTWGWYVNALAARYRSSGTRVRSRPAVDVMREALLRADSKGVTIVAVGLATNLYDLLESRGGAALVRSKVREVRSRSRTRGACTTTRQQLP